MDGPRRVGPAPDDLTRDSVALVSWRLRHRPLPHRPIAPPCPSFLTNRVLLCGPCNGRKKERSTLPGLYQENKRVGWMRVGWMRDEPKARAAIDAARRVSGRVRDAWASPDVQALVAAARGEG